MKATRFMRQPFFVTGYQVSSDNMDAIAKWCGGHVVRDTARPFVRVPVDRVTKNWQTEAHIGTWVLKAIQGNETNQYDSFKVYTQEWLDRNFFEYKGPIPAADDLDEDFLEKEAPLSGETSVVSKDPFYTPQGYVRKPPTNNRDYGTNSRVA